MEIEVTGNFAKSVREFDFVSAEDDNIFVNSVGKPIYPDYGDADITSGHIYPDYIDLN